MKMLLKSQTTLVWGLAVLCFILISPKWMVAPAAWLAPAFLLNFMSRVNFKKRLWLGLLALAVSGIVAGYGVMPFPLVFFVIMTIVGSIIKIIPYLVAAWLTPKLKNGAVALFIFPCALVAVEYLDSFGGGGTWGSIAYSQFENQALTQILSIGGIWTITFLIGWFASLLNFAIESRFKRINDHSLVLPFAIVLIAVVTFGYIRINPAFHDGKRTERIAGITANNVELMKELYEIYFEKKIDVNPDEMTMSSPELAEMQKAFIKFIENPSDQKFEAFYPLLETYHNGLLAQASREAQAGAKLIVFSEGLLVVTKEDEPMLMEKCGNVARENGVYLAASIASLLPGEIKTGSKYMENKIVFFNPDGSVQTTFLKNKPVPMVEGSIQGDGEIPVIDTSIGRIALSICYDADFPSLIRKAGQQGADILLLPSGDWKEISPYHAQMAVCRAIENGFSLFRMASGARSVATDHVGRTLANKNFYDHGEKIMVAHVPISGVKTLYSQVGDILPQACLVGLVVIGFLAFRRSLFYRPFTQPVRGAVLRVFYKFMVGKGK